MSGVGDLESTADGPFDAISTALMAIREDVLLIKSCIRSIERDHIALEEVLS